MPTSGARRAVSSVLSRAGLRRGVGLLASRAGSAARTELAHRGGGEAGRLEQLEARAMLSATDQLPDNASIVAWGSSRLAAITGSYVVGFDEAMGHDNAELMVRDLAARLGITAANVQAIGRGRYATFSTDRLLDKATAQRLADEMPGIEGIVPNRVYQSSRAPNDSLYLQQYGLNNTGQTSGQLGNGTPGADIDAERAWDITIGSREVIVGVIDTGFDMTHADLAANYYRNPGEVAGNGLDDDNNGVVDDISGYDFGNLDSDPTEDQFSLARNGGSHGTWVAGVIGAVGNNGIGVTGVAWNVSILPLKITNEFGALTIGAIVGAHDYVTSLRQQGVNVAVTNNSYGAFQFAGDFYDDVEGGFDPERQAIARYIASGGVFVVAAGNESNNNDEVFTSYPAAYAVPGVIAVAATDNNDQLANFSSYGVRTTDVAAPGVQILTTAFGGGYEYVNGTSFSSPTVAGAVALLRSAKPNASAVEIREALINSSDTLPALQGRVRSGGRINIARALEVIGADGPNLRTFEPGPVTTQVDSASGLPVRELRFEFSEDLDPNAAFFNTSGLRVTGDGPDNALGTPDDVVIPIGAIALQPGNARRVIVTLNTTALPVDTYEVRLLNGGFRDLAGNRLLGNSAAGTDEVRSLRVVSASGDNESNDTIATATPVNFGSSGEARFDGAFLGNGVAGTRDVDFYRLNLTRPGQITAEISAQRLSTPSPFDGVLRLFDPSGNEIARNDQFFGLDPYLSTFVTTAGSYYLGVSGFGNTEYNPRVLSSGTTQSTGLYNIRIASALAQDDVVNFNSVTYAPSAQPALPLNIPRGGEPGPALLTQGTTTAAIVIPDTREIIDLNLRLAVSHTAIGDLRISLISPAGTEVLMSNLRGADADGYGTVNAQGQITGFTTFDDEAASSITAGTAPYVGNFRPEQSLGLFDGEDGNGTWTIRIVDTKPQDSGRLLDWDLTFTFQNDVFGFLESNDTATNATNAGGINGTGSFATEAFIGDGGFGSLDRDVFRFAAAPGSSITARAFRVLPTAANPNPTLALDSALRLFDGAGNPILTANPNTTFESTIQNYVVANGGTFYIAVSEGANIGYNINNPSSGSPSITTGKYRLTIDVAPGVSDGAIALSGGRVRTDVDSGGRLGVNSLSLDGFNFLPANTEFLGASASGQGFSNDATSALLPFGVVDQSDPFNERASIRGVFNGLSISRTISFADTDGFIAIDVTLLNTQSTRMSSVAWMEGFNPDPGLTLNESTRATLNDVSVDGKAASARYVNNTFQQGITIALAAVPTDTRAKATVLPQGTVIRDAAVLVAQAAIDPNNAPSDGILALSYNIGDLLPGQSATFRYFILMGTTPSQVSALTSAIADGTGKGHLAANPAQPGTDALRDGTPVPALPYEVAYPEGFFGPNIFNFIPISNPNDRDARVVVIQHFELNNGQPSAQRDRVVADIIVPARARRGVDVNTPQLYKDTLSALSQVAATPLVNVPDLTTADPNDRINLPAGLPYSLEIRSDVPVSATFSYYDLTQIPSGPVAVGESFTPEVSSTWSFGGVEKLGGFGTADIINSYVLLYNPDASRISKVTLRFFRQTTGDTPAEIYRITRDIEAGGRSGVFLSDAGFDLESTLIEENNLRLPDGTYGVQISATVPVVAAKTTYNPAARQATGTVANTGSGSTTGVLLEGQFGLRGDSDTIGILNPNTAEAQVTLSFVYPSGTTIRQLVTVQANAHKTFSVSDVPNFVTGQPYSVAYESTVPVSLSASSPVTETSTGFSDAFSVTTATRAYTAWGFGEGFRPGDNSDWSTAPGRQAHPGLIENLRLYNPSNEPVTVEIVFNFDLEPGQDTYRRTIPARTVTEFNVDEFISANRKPNNQAYGIFIKSATPIVAEMSHYDRLFPGAFATLGTPMGISGIIG